MTEDLYDQAAELLAQHHPDATNHSEPYWEGYLDAVAWHLAGQPGQTSRDSRYTLGTVQRDAWSYGWMSGQQFADQLDSQSA